MRKIFLIIFLLAFAPIKTFAAVGCDLNDPDRDVKRLFPSSTGYKTLYFSVKSSGGEEMLKEIEQRLGDKFTGLYETIDVPYTLYTIYKGKEKAGYIHGVNQKGKYGGIQIFLVFDANGKVIDFYFQKMTSRSAKKLRSQDFTKQFIGLTLNSFDKFTSKIKAPDPESDNDLKAILRGTKKNLILMDLIVFNPKKWGDKK